MPCTSSSLDECVEADHCFEHGGQCCHCGKPKDTLPRGGAEGVHVHEWGTWETIGLDRAEVWIRRCLCGASQSRSEKPEEPEAERWKTARCRDCEEPIPQGWTLCMACAQEPVCTHCQGPHALEDCKGLEEPEAHEHDWGKYMLSDTSGAFESQFRTCKTCGISEVHTGYLDPSELEQGACAHEAWEERNPSSEGRVSRWCTACGHYMGRFDAEPAPMPIPRRPPYAVAYAVEGGAQYEVAVSGDATVVAEDGALHILHPKKPVLAIVRVQPMHMEDESNG